MTAITIPTSHSTYGRVVCRIIRRVGDGDDTGTEPDALPMSGTITFTPLTKWDRTTDYSALASNEAITGQLNPLTGEMMSPGQPPTIGVDLLVGVYSVSFALDHGTFAPFNVEVKASHTAVAPLDLAHEVPYSPPPGVQTTMLVPSGITDGYLLSVSGGALVGVDPATLGGGGSGGSTAWADITGKPAVIAAGADAAEARAAISAGTSSFSGAYADLTGKPTLGTAAATAATDYATAAQGAKADSALQTATPQPINAQTGTTYTLQASDAGKLVTLTNADAITLTVPGSVFTAGQRVDCLVAGAGMVTAVGSSCTVNGTPSLVSRAQYSAFTVLFTSATTAVMVGDLT